MSELYHIGIEENMGIKYAILAGDPGRIEKIANHLSEPKFINTKREYTSYRGKIDDTDVIVMSTGMGGPSMAIAIEELYRAGVRTFIRVGTCGGMQSNVVGGDIVIATGAIRMEGTTKEYTPIEYPAVADFEVANALVQGAKNGNMSYHIGIVQSKDSFYGQHNPMDMPIGYELQNKWDAFIKTGCLASEMECAALFIISSILKVRSGAVLSVVWNQEREKHGLENPKIMETEDSIKTAVEAIRILINNDLS